MDAVMDFVHSRRFVFQKRDVGLHRGHVHMVTA
jgi:hypothetical protein